jgi:hypothetical protein
VRSGKASRASWIGLLVLAYWRRRKHARP